MRYKGFRGGRFCWFLSAAFLRLAYYYTVPSTELGYAPKYAAILLLDRVKSKGNFVFDDMNSGLNHHSPILNGELPYGRDPSLLLCCDEFVPVIVRFDGDSYSP